MDERLRFLARLKEGERMSELCEEFGISRKTGYKMRDRYEELGPAGLLDQSRAPQRIPHRTPEAIEKVVVEARRAHPTWGPKKLLTLLERKHRGMRFPAISTIDVILRRHQLIKARQRKPRTPTWSVALRAAKAPNEIWCADFKGQFRLGNGRYCYPLTVTDRFSRALLCCEALESTKVDSARTTFELVFREYGLPNVIRTDNGVPFATRGLAGLSRLSLWWLRLGIVPERIEPGHPEQNATHERMHLTLKQETTRPAGKNVLQQQERFDGFRATFNEERPHEALGQRTPSQVYEPSKRAFPAQLPELEYPLHDETRVVEAEGHVRYPGCSRNGAVFLSSALGGERVGLREVDDGLWLVSYAALDLGHINARSGCFARVEDIASCAPPDASHPALSGFAAGPLNAKPSS